MFKGGERTKTDFIDDAALDAVLSLLMPQNRLIAQVAIATGLRIGDVVSLRTARLNRRMTVTEAKTGKSRRVSIPPLLLERIRKQAGPVWAFPGSPNSKQGHKSRQAVWADIKRAQRAMRLPNNLGPHTLRKVYAVRQLKHHKGDIAAVSQLMGHTDQAVTMIYAMADYLTQQRLSEGSKHPSKPK